MPTTTEILDYAKVEQASKALVSPDDLNGVEQELYLDRLLDSYLAPCAIEDKFFADLRSNLGI